MCIYLAARLHLACWSPAVLPAHDVIDAGVLVFKAAGARTAAVSRDALRTLRQGLRILLCC